MRNFYGLFLGATMVSVIFLAGCPQREMRDSICAVPPDVIVLFNGTDFSQWTSENGKPVQWKIIDGSMEVLPGSGSIMTKKEFQDFKLHIEFNLPRLPQRAKGQDRANSGVYLQRRYEVQILDSFGLSSKNDDCGAIYKVKPPDKNVCKKPGRWQTYDIIFHPPRFLGEGDSVTKVENARITVLHNGVLIHDNVEIPSKTGLGQPEGPEPAPILLQDHGSKVRFRNIWVIPLDGAS